MIRLGSWGIFDKKSHERKSTGDGDIEQDVFEQKETLLRNNESAGITLLGILNPEVTTSENIL